jgi:hypothetical protein
MEGFVSSDHAVEKARRAIEAAAVFRDHAPAIASACFDAMDGEAILAVVAPDLTFQGVWVIGASALRDKLTRWNDGRWTLVFAPGCCLGEITERLTEMEELARARWEALHESLGAMWHPTPDRRLVSRTPDIYQRRHMAALYVMVMPI